MNHHFRSYSESTHNGGFYATPIPAQPAQNNNNDKNNNNNGSTIQISDGSSTIRFHSDSQQSLDRLFNPHTNEGSNVVPLRQRNLPSSFFNPTQRDGEQKPGQAPHINLHARSTSYGVRPTSSIMHMRTQSVLAPMTNFQEDSPMKIPDNGSTKCSNQSLHSNNYTPNGSTSNLASTSTHQVVQPPVAVASSHHYRNYSSPAYMNNNNNAQQNVSLVSDSSLSHMKGTNEFMDAHSAGKIAENHNKHSFHYHNNHSATTDSNCSMTHQQPQLAYQTVEHQSLFDNGGHHNGHHATFADHRHHNQATGSTIHHTPVPPTSNGNNNGNHCSMVQVIQPQQQVLHNHHPHHHHHHGHEQLATSNSHLHHHHHHHEPQVALASDLHSHCHADSIHPTNHHPHHQQQLVHQHPPDNMAVEANRFQVSHSYHQQPVFNQLNHSRSNSYDQQQQQVGAHSRSQSNQTLLSCGMSNLGINGDINTTSNNNNNNPQAFGVSPAMDQDGGHQQFSQMIAPVVPSGNSACIMSANPASSSVVVDHQSTFVAQHQQQTLPPPPHHTHILHHHHQQAVISNGPYNSNQLPFAE